MKGFCFCGKMQTMPSEKTCHQISDAKLEAILDAGLRHFLTNGFARAIVSEIACDADVSTATVYKQFRSKEELFAAVVAKAANAASGYSDLSTMEGDAGAILSAVVERYLNVQFNARVNDLLRIVIGEATTSPELAKGMFDLIVMRRHRSFRVVLDAMVERGLLRPHDTSLSATFATGLIKEMVIWPALFDPDYRPPEDMDRRVREGIALLLAYYGPR